MNFKKNSPGVCYNWGVNYYTGESIMPLWRLLVPPKGLIQKKSQNKLSYKFI